ncbi:hypothetical protein PoB_006170600 [Plakobranchus ocellatus]|uniref:FHA domain-containing protein n=1 Tax=Plakobranchus ocellatus TaxID=259542 RepID=A0AAV4CTH3_9GAST|nr:hypothetical protein PoB_006170600 [Plakobranchus ocellatus]
MGRIEQGSNRKVSLRILQAHTTLVSPTVSFPSQKIPGHKLGLGNPLTADGKALSHHQCRSPITFEASLLISRTHLILRGHTSALHVSSHYAGERPGLSGRRRLLN